MNVSVFQYLNHVPFLANLSLGYYKLVSSAYIIQKLVYDTALKLFISIRNNKGPNSDPCGTPQVIFLRTELV